MLKKLKIVYAIIFILFTVLVLPISGIAQQTGPQVEVGERELIGQKDAKRSKQSGLHQSINKIVVIEGGRSKGKGDNQDYYSLKDKLTAANEDLDNFLRDLNRVERLGEELRRYAEMHRTGAAQSTVEKAKRYWLKGVDGEWAWMHRKCEDYICDYWSSTGVMAERGQVARPVNCVVGVQESCR